jgi:hypothetical protein
VRTPILPKSKTTTFAQVQNPKVVFFIKPWDDEVFASFIKILTYEQCAWRPTYLLNVW